MFNILNTFPIVCKAFQTPIYFDTVTMQTANEATIHIVNGITYTTKIVACMM